jgi:hypothetical protein
MHRGAKDVDGRVEPGHDENWVLAASSINSPAIPSP